MNLCAEKIVEIMGGGSPCIFIMRSGKEHCGFAKRAEEGVVACEVAVLRRITLVASNTDASRLDAIAGNAKWVETVLASRSGDIFADALYFENTGTLMLVNADDISVCEKANNTKHFGPPLIREDGSLDEQQVCIALPEFARYRVPHGGFAQNPAAIVGGRILTFPPPSAKQPSSDSVG